MVERAPVALLDANLLVALVVGDHVHHAAAERWLATHDRPFATCPITQAALVRLLVGEGAPAAEAARFLGDVLADGRHQFWPDDLGFDRVDLAPVVGHRQVTDAYLAGLARARAGRLATFDRGLAAVHPDVVELVAS